MDIDWNSVAIWSFYNVAVPAVAPVVLVWTGLWLQRKPKALLEIVGDGQLCFFAIALLAVTVNDIHHMSDQKRSAAGDLEWAYLSCVLCIGIIIYVFGLIVAENAANTQADKGRSQSTRAGTARDGTRP